MMTASDIRSLAREHLAGRWGVSILTAAIAIILGGAIAGSSFLPKIEWRQPLEQLREQGFLFTAFGLAGTLAAGGSILGIAQLILGGTVELGYAKYLLQEADGQSADCKLLFSAFDRFGTGFAQHLLRVLFVVLWSLLLVIPGIVAGYSYAMTPMILAENPDLTAMEAIRKSKEMMQGHKWRLFCLDFSFIGWAILCALTLNLGNLALNPYQNAAHAVFYRDLVRQNRYAL